MSSRKPLLLLFVILILLSACSEPVDEDAITITLVADGQSQVMLINPEVTVGDVLRESGIVLEQDDRVNPPGHNRVSDGMTITIVRVREETVVIEEEIPFERRTAFNDGLPVGQSQLLQSGVNGVDEVTYRVVYQDGVEISRTPVRRVSIRPPQDEVIMVGSQSDLTTVTVTGTLAYISSSNAWIIRQNSANRRALTTEGGVDGRVFSMSPDGVRLLFSRQELIDGEEDTPQGPVEDSEEDATSVTDVEELTTAFNTLWAVLDTTDPTSQPVQIDIENILYADWVPGTEDEIVYSTAEPRLSFPGWQANNDLWRARINDAGELINPTQILESSGGGIYGWYGTFFAFAPNGETLAWAQPDAVGILDAVRVPVDDDDEETPTPPPDEEDEFESPLAEAYERRTLLSFAPRNAYDFIWVPGLAWSPDGEVIATTTHGPPLGNETPEDSPVFNLTLLPGGGGYSVDLIERAGMWSLAQFAPLPEIAGSTLETPISFLEAIDPLDSVASRYRLVVMDRDGSNRRTIFPPEGQPGLRTGVYPWSPNGNQIAFVYLGNLFMIDVETSVIQQLTADGLSHSPRWTR